MSSMLSLGIDVGGTNLRAGVFDEAGSLLWQERHPSNFAMRCARLPSQQALSVVMDALAATIAAALATQPRVSAVGIGFPGFIDPVSGVLSTSPNLPGVRDIQLAAQLMARFDIPVIVENDALAAAYGEYCLQPTASGSLIYLGLGTGVGGGMILAGRPHAGERGVAMEVGHLIVVPAGRPCGCGNRGCLEQYASASGVSHYYEEATGKLLDAEALSVKAKVGDADAQAAFRDGAEKLAFGLSHVLKIVDIGNVVVGGGVSRSWPLLAAHFDEALDEALIPALRGKIHVRPSSAQDRAGMLGAALLARPGQSRKLP